MDYPNKTEREASLSADLQRWLLHEKNKRMQDKPDKEAIEKRRKSFYAYYLQGGRNIADLITYCADAYEHQHALVEAYRGMLIETLEIIDAQNKGLHTAFEAIGDGFKEMSALIATINETLDRSRF